MLGAVAVGIADDVGSWKLQMVRAAADGHVVVVAAVGMTTAGPFAPFAQRQRASHHQRPWQEQPSNSDAAVVGLGGIAVAAAVVAGQPRPFVDS